MKATLIAIGLVVVLAIGLTVLAGLARADDSKVPRSPDAVLAALVEAGKPGPEHKKLEPFVGDWSVTIKMWTDPSQAPAEITGNVERKWIMGGRFVQETFHGECCKTGKTCEAMGLLGYDASQKKFTFVKACDMRGTISSGLVSCDASGKTFACATEECCPLTGQKVKGRDEVIIESNDRIVTNVFKNVDGKEVKAMEVVSIRKK